MFKIAIVKIKRGGEEDRREEGRGGEGREGKGRKE